jgi:ATP-binding cassette subfamily B protein
VSVVEEPKGLRARLRDQRRLAEVVVGTGFRAAPRLMVLGVASTTVGAVASTLCPLGFRIMVDAILRHDPGRIAFGAGVFAILYSVSWLLGITGASRNSVLTDRVNLYLGERIATLVAGTPGLAHLERPDPLRRIDQLRGNRRTLAGAPRQLLQAWQTIIRLGVSAILLALIYPPVLLVPAFAIAPFLADRRASRLQQRSDDELAEDRRLLDDLFTLATTAGPAKELRTYGITGALQARHRLLAESLRRRQVRAALRSAGWEALGWILYAAGFVGAIVVLVLRAAGGQASLGDVVLAVSLLRRSQTQVSNATDTAGTLGTSVRTARQLLWLEDYAAAEQRPGAAAPPARLRSGIELDGVSFAYPGSEKPVLEGIDLELRAGETVAIVGENGAGKTTLVKLLSAMYRPTTGRIRLDGDELDHYDPEAWRERVTATFQDFVRFQFDARHSVGVGDLPRLGDDAAILDALGRAEAGAFVERLPHGLDTQLGRAFTHGQELSGGQWQRIALARGLMRSAPLLIVLDEPTASLDARAESALFARFAQVAGVARGTGAITLLVTHRFSSVRTADRIVVLERGRLIESGTHRELIAAGGLYAELLELQARALVDVGPA